MATPGTAEQPVSELDSTENLFRFTKRKRKYENSPSLVQMHGDIKMQ